MLDTAAVGRGASGRTSLVRNTDKLHNAKSETGTNSARYCTAALGVESASHPSANVGLRPHGRQIIRLHWLPSFQLSRCHLLLLRDIAGLCVPSQSLGSLPWWTCIAARSFRVLNVSLFLAAVFATKPKPIPNLQETGGKPGRSSISWTPFHRLAIELQRL